MNRLAIVITVCCMATPLASHRAIFADETNNSKVRVGTFDSRLVATAYVRSEAFQKRLAKLHADLKEAKTSGDEKRIRQLEAKGPALQTLIHKQGFSTWPVHDILRTIKDEIPGIAKQANVDVVVSKWDVVFQRKDVKFVDVTDLMVAPFHPTEETRKILEDLANKDPVPLEQLRESK
jgi:hypothetical protein